MQQIRVRPTDDLQAVIRSAVPGDQLVLLPGEYAGNYVIDKPLGITGDGSGGTIILTAQAGNCLQVRESRAIIGGLTLRSASQSVTLLNIDANDVIVDDCVLNGAKTTVRVQGSNITVNHCSISGGSVGLYLDECGQVDILDCTIQENRITGVLCTNLKKDTKLVDCTIAQNRGPGLSTANDTPEDKYARLYGPSLYHCRIHHNETYGVYVGDQGRAATLERCRIHNNTQAQAYLNDAAYLYGCDIAGGETGVVIAGGRTSDLRRCTIHDTRVGISANSPHSGDTKYTFVIACRIYDITETACRATDGGFLHLFRCVIRDNQRNGIEVGAGGTQELKQCRIVRNNFGMIVWSGGTGRIGESIISQNGTGVYAEAGSEVGVGTCHIEQHTRVAVILEKDTTGRLMDCLFRSNAAGDIRRNPQSETDMLGDPTIDYLEKSQRLFGERQIPKE
jgi:Right handed beta helix region